MKIYEESGSVQQQVGGGGFNPVQEPDVASAMERELRAGERRDQLFYNSVTQNNQYKVQEAEAVAERMNRDIDKNLKAISQFSQTATKILDQRTVDKINRDMEAAAQQAWIDPIYAEKETQQFEQDESKIEEGQTIMNEAAVKYEANGGSPIIGEGLRTQFTGRNRVAYERARMERLSYEFPSYYASKLSEINATQDPDVRAARELAVVNAFLRETGAAGTSPGMLNKYLMRNMRKVTSKAQLAWTTETEKGILAGRIDEAQSELWTGMTSGNISSASSDFLTKMQSLGKTPLEAKQELFKFLESNEGSLSREDINQLRTTPIDHPAGDTFGKVFGRELDALDGKVADNQNKMLERGAQERAAKSKDYENAAMEEITKLQQAGTPPSAEYLEQVRTIGREKGYDVSFIDDIKTAESLPLEVGKRKLESIWQKQGFLTPNDLKGVPAAVRQDKDVQNWLQTGNVLSGQTKDQKDAVETSTKRLANTISQLSFGDVKGVEYDRVERDVRRELNAQYVKNLSGTKYRNADGTLDYDAALSDAVDTVQQGAYDPTTQKGRKYGEPSTDIERATRGNSRYEQRIQVYKGELNKDPKFLSNNLFSTNAELDQAEKALNGQGGYPAAYEDLAAGQVNITPYDIAMAQMQKAGRKLEPQPVEEAVKSQDPGIQRLLNFKPNVNRTERAFTPNFNDPSVLSRNMKLSSTERGALDALARYESQNVGNYNAVNQIGTKGGHGVLGYSGHYNRLGGRDLTSMNVGEIMSLQASRPGMSNAEWIRQGRLHAVGRYQMIGPTFARVVQAMGIKPNQQFTPELQDQMGLWLLRNGGGGINQWVGPANYATASERDLIRRAQRGSN
jgi:hypothetical protein